MASVPKSRTLRKVFVKTPGGRVATQYRKKKPSKAICSETGQELHGVPRQRPYKIQRMAKTEKRPERPYGGVLSGSAMRAVMKKKARLVE